jgi:hypothetical protein
MEWRNHGLHVTQKPETQAQSPSLQRMEEQVLAKYKPGQMVVYSAELGPETTFYRWRREATNTGKLVYSNGCYFVPIAKEDERPN